MRFSYLGPNLRYFRLRRHLTQEDLARRAAATLRGRGFSQTYISRLERGMKPASAEHVDALAAALKVSVPTLLARPRIVRAAEGRPVIIATEGVHTPVHADGPSAAPRFEPAAHRQWAVSRVD